MNNQQALIHIQGEVGKLETIYLPAKGVEQGVAVIHHPNPTQGGTFTNKVIQTAAKCLTTMGFHCYLPNSRGTGNSEGVHDYGKGESEDLVHVIDFARAQHSNAPKFILSGFSFGGYVSTFAAQQREPDVLLLIGAAVGFYEVPAPHVPNINKTLMIHGANDEVVELARPLKWAAEQNMPVVVIPESSHFFHGKLIHLRDTINRFVPPML
ncbi:alpha/beta fold hydrolase [Kingella negevensis]|uniref:Alpha/beta hydrolase family protein n=1 Tax=Kingella negevensis TaxID=1522312 RepID=A0A238HEG7_9NEIS|nr:alpha/beta fold hydrolase [Kingella negevensis]MDK4679930.1 alpha/beta fold hydrolase [Kingella negevensis]MDK4682351.1 alpha/beta fold hydrolase [Kingella negevensis]MDK4684603.1 alpha/beta fold hydrolase [Kingella negevensis]MDK4690548.1 alpha/beta fold hydrolase [Kingella negevensis]MDK4692104.1 alpha/beta fold hydrolase [Kingella negevensis]